MIVEQGPIALAAGAGGFFFGHFYPQLSFLSSFSLSLGDGPKKIEIPSQRAVKPKTTNQPTNLIILGEVGWLFVCWLFWV